MPSLLQSRSHLLKLRHAAAGCQQAASPNHSPHPIAFVGLQCPGDIKQAFAQGEQAGTLWATAADTTGFDQVWLAYLLFCYDIH